MITKLTPFLKGNLLKVSIFLFLIADVKAFIVCLTEIVEMCSIFCLIFKKDT